MVHSIQVRSGNLELGMTPRLSKKNASRKRFLSCSLQTSAAELTKRRQHVPVCELEVEGLTKRGAEQPYWIMRDRGVAYPTTCDIPTGNSNSRVELERTKESPKLTH